jgi:hypothetical protein
MKKFFSVMLNGGNSGQQDRGDGEPLWFHTFTLQAQVKSQEKWGALGLGGTYLKIQATRSEGCQAHMP